MFERWKKNVNYFFLVTPNQKSLISLFFQKKWNFYFCLFSLIFYLGSHCEGGVFVTMFGLIFWDIIFDSSIPRSGKKKRKEKETKEKKQSEKGTKEKEKDNEEKRKERQSLSFFFFPFFRKQFLGLFFLCFCLSIFFPSLVQLLF